MTMDSVWTQRFYALFRIVAGLLFFEHGLQKLFGWPHSPNFDNLHALQLLWFAGIIETVGGALVALGLFTRAAAFIMSGEMAVAYFYSHFPRGFFPALNGGDAAILYSLLFFYFFLVGGGLWSIDRARS